MYKYKLNNESEFKYEIVVGYTSGSTFGRDEYTHYDTIFQTDSKEIANEVAKMFILRSSLKSKTESSFGYYDYKDKKEIKVARDLDLKRIKEIEEKLMGYGFIESWHGNKNGKFPSYMCWEGYFESLESMEVKYINPEEADLFKYNVN